jgi:uncharacterized protein Usg
MSPLQELEKNWIKEAILYGYVLKTLNMLYRCPDTRERTTEFIVKNWLDMNEDLAQREGNGTNETQVRKGH